MDTALAQGDHQASASHTADVFYWSSQTQNTHLFAQRLLARDISVAAISPRGAFLATKPFVLITPTYSDGKGEGAVPKIVIQFLNVLQNRQLLRGVVGGGNRNFGATYVLGAKEVAYRCKVPMLGDFELSGTEREADLIAHAVQNILQYQNAAH